MSRKLRVAVTGGSGNIGSRLCQALVERGDEVFNLDRRQPEVPAGKFIY
jgi:nucleoside-diphosphate-sugar epimerase